MSKLDAKDVGRIVVRSTNWVGDAVMTVPALRRLRQVLPNAHITLATHRWASDLFREADFIDDIMISDTSSRLSVFRQSREWSSRDFDLALLFPNSFGSALVPALAKVPVRIGYATEHRNFLLTKAVPLPGWRSMRHEVYYYLHLVDELKRLVGNQAADEELDGSLRVSSASIEEARKILSSRGVGDERLVVALCPGSINSRAKRWPAESYASLADMLIEQLDATCVLIGSSSELDVTLTVQNRMMNKPVLLTGSTSLSQLIGILNRVDLLISNDTGPAHIASALDRPTLVIFGPTNPLTTSPFCGHGEVLRKPPDCAPCMLRDCPIDHRCMTSITPAEVFEKARNMLERKNFGSGTFQHLESAVR